MNRRSVLAPLLVAAGLRLLLLAAALSLTGTHAITQGDTASYLEPGRNLFLHGSYSTAGLPETDRTPGYPIFLMLSGMVFGSNMVTVAIAVSMQIVLSLLTLQLVYKVGSRLFPETDAGLMAAWFYAVEPVSITYCVRLMPETLFVCLLLTALERLLAYRDTARLNSIGAAGVLLAAATYIRPVSYYLVAPLALALVFASPSARLVWKPAVVLLATVLPLLAIWQVRNQVLTGYSGFSSVVEKNLYFYQSAEVIAESRHQPLPAVQSSLGYPDEVGYLAAHPEQKGWSATERLRLMKTQAAETIAAHPGTYLRSHLRGVGIVAFTPCAADLLQLLGLYPDPATMPQRVVNEGVAGGAMRVLQAHPAVAATMLLLEAGLLLLYGLAVFGLIYGRGNRWQIGLLAGTILYFLLISGGAQAVGRYRLPALPLVCVLAGGGLAMLRAKEGRRLVASARSVRS
jgi:4-amino-4-deoxy-L-arabinose transferase-like glycosyltransferase